MVLLRTLIVLRAVPAVVLAAGLLSGCAAETSRVPTVPRQQATVTPAPLDVPEGAQRVEVRWVTDGDTLTVRAVRRGPLPRGVDTTVRLLEIDTPESQHPDLPVQCFALRATRALERLAPVGSSAWLVADREESDRYHRALRYLWNADGVFVNERLVRRGLARAVLVAPNDRFIDRVRAAEDDARRNGRGLWGAC